MVLVARSWVISDRNQSTQVNVYEPTKFWGSIPHLNEIIATWPLIIVTTLWPGNRLKMSCGHFHLYSCALSHHRWPRRDKQKFPNNDPNWPLAPVAATMAQNLICEFALNDHSSATGENKPKGHCDNKYHYHISLAVWMTKSRVGGGRLGVFMKICVKTI